MKVKISARQLKSYLFGLLVISFNFGDYFKIAGRAYSQYIAAVLMLLSIPELMGVFRQYKKQGQEKRIVLFLVVFWAAASMVQVFWVGDIASWKLGIRSLFINLFICFEMCVLFRNNQEYLLVMKSIEVSLLLSIAVGLCEVFVGIHFDTNVQEAAFRDEIRSFLGNPNDYATWIILCLLGVTLYYAKRKRRYICIVEWVLGLFVIYHTGSRSGMLSVLTAVFFILMGNALKFVGSTRDGATGKKKAFHVLGIVSAMALGGLFLLGGDVVAIINKFSSASTSDVFRLKIIEGSLGVALKYVLMGAGANQTTFYVGINPHNFLLELFADYGILVAAVIIYILWKIFIRMFDEKGITAYGIACYAFVPTFLLISIASSSMARLRIMWVVLLLYYFVSAEQTKERKSRIKILNLHRRVM